MMIFSKGDIAMKFFIFPSNPKYYRARESFETLRKLHWKQGRTKMVDVGDIVYIYEAKPTQGLIVKAKVLETNVTKYHIDDSAFSNSIIDFGMNPPWFTLEKVQNISSIINLGQLSDLGIKGNIQSIREIPSNVANKIENLIGDISFNPLESVIYEGKKKLIYTTKYERSPENRRKAIEYHGLNCAACGFNFSKAYGNLGADYIEIHHVKPLFSMEEEIVVDPLKDLIPLCSNCHRMVHRHKNEILSVSELKKIINENKK
ncbi:hypothetical protein FC80_GL000235 [Liquorilactobacillus cacaonum DSM 21116]|uniref:HNH domain-containing protein n=2 Tax=Liquorilactobacillus cacaonum TaxID=483012 RepID=A0A0R2CVZ9_9LACO|nr:hypothetical protein FC80_GL000235 [Liquorilactobacillus cacaonum DSM 21116]